MPETTMRAALNDALKIAMRDDPDVFVMGEDIAGGQVIKAWDVADELTLCAFTYTWCSK